MVLPGRPHTRSRAGQAGNQTRLPPMASATTRAKSSSRQRRMTPASGTMDMPAMRKLAALAAAVLIAAIGFAAEAGQLVSTQFRSPALGRDWVYNVYLPDGYETGRLRYPVLYLLHGNGADQNEWVAKGMVHRTVDALIADGEIPPCLVVMPSAGVTWYAEVYRQPSLPPGGIGGGTVG